MGGEGEREHHAGTLVGIVVLLSAATASAQGLQNLALGLRQRHYVPASFGQRNRFDVADRPVAVQVIIVGACFIAFGTHEDTYLALYAAGVFVLLGLTGWASVKRLLRERRAGATSTLSVVATTVAAVVTSGAAGLIFFERLRKVEKTNDSAGTSTTYAHAPSVKRLGAPTPIEERLGRVLAEQKSFVPGRRPAWERPRARPASAMNSVRALLSVDRGPEALVAMILKGAAVLLLTFGLARVVSRLVERTLNRRGHPEGVQYAFGRMSRYGSRSLGSSSP